MSVQSTRARFGEAPVQSLYPQPTLTSNANMNIATAMTPPALTPSGQTPNDIFQKSQTMQSNLYPNTPSTSNASMSGATTLPSFEQKANEALDVLQKTVAAGGNRAQAQREYSRALGKLTVPTASEPELNAFCNAQQVAEEASKNAYHQALAATGNKEYAQQQRESTLYNVAEPALKATPEGRAFMVKREGFVPTLPPAEQKAIDDFQRTVASGGDPVQAERQFSLNLGKLTAPTASEPELNAFCNANQLASEVSRRAYQQALAATGNEQYAQQQRATAIFSVSGQALRATPEGRAFMAKAGVQPSLPSPNFNRPVGQ